MAFRNLFCKILGQPSHLPTWFFILGYPIFWIELYFFKAPHGVTSMLAWDLFLLVLILFSIFYFKESNLWQGDVKNFWKSLGLINKLIVVVGLLLSVGIFIIVILAGTLPIHLIQEFDCMQYHYALPRQHLILGSFVHIPWAADDLFLLPLDFSLAPFWFASTLPNKLPQLIIFFGLIAVVVRLTLAMTKNNDFWVAISIIFAILGSHGLGIQMGTGMLDLTIAYLFFASIDSLRQSKWLMAAIEFVFFFWSKPLIPFQILIIITFVIGIVLLVRCFKWKIVKDFDFSKWPKTLLAFLLLSILVGGPFVLKSIDYAATPLFPWAPGIMGETAKIKLNPLSWNSLQQASDNWMYKIKDGYGHGRGAVAFVKHWWLIAIPEQGVNNAFDYPLGLPYLLLTLPFVVLFIKDVVVRKISLFSILTIIIWLLWWFGAQQTRYLYIPLLIIFIVTLARGFETSKYLKICLIIALFLNLISLLGAHKKDLFSCSKNVLRVQDKELVRISGVYIQQRFRNYINYSSHDIAYAQFPVKVNKEALPHTIKF